MQHSATSQGGDQCASGSSPRIQNSVPDQSPTLYKTDRDSWLVQGWVVADPATLAEMNIPEGETVVEIPDRLVPFFRES